MTHDELCNDVETVITGLWARFQITDEIHSQLWEWFQGYRADNVAAIIREHYGSNPDGWPKWTQVRAVLAKRYRSSQQRRWCWNDEVELRERMANSIRFSKHAQQNGRPGWPVTEQIILRQMGQNPCQEEREPAILEADRQYIAMLQRANQHDEATAYASQRMISL